MNKQAILIGIGAGILIVAGIFVYSIRKTAGETRQPSPTTQTPGTSTTNIPSPAEKEWVVNVYYANTKQDPEMLDCGKVYPVARTVANDNDTLYNTLRALFAGPTEAEQAQGFSSMFSDKTKDILMNARIDGTIAYVDLIDIRSIIPNASASCGSQAFFASVKETLHDLAGVTEVRYAIAGDPESFYEWMQIGCGQNTAWCDSKPFVEFYTK